MQANAHPRSRAILGQISDIDLRLLRVFKAVADCGGMAAAELELNIAVSTISRHVKDLETRLGMTLCRRGRGGFVLTPEGAQVFAATERLLGATAAFRGQLNDIRNRMVGDLNVAMFEKTASNPNARIAAAIGRFRALAPKVVLHLHVGTIGMIERGVIDGRFDLGLIPEHRRSETLRYDELFDETMLLYAGRGHAWFSGPDDEHDWTELRRQDLAGLNYHSPNLELTHAKRLERAASASDQEAVATLVLSGAYVGFLPDHYAEPFVRAKRMRAVSKGQLEYRCRFSCIHRHAPAPQRIAQAFRETLIAAHR